MDDTRISWIFKLNLQASFIENMELHTVLIVLFEMYKSGTFVHVSELYFIL